MTTSEVAAALGYSASTLRHWSQCGDGPIRPHRVGNGTHLRWLTNDVRRVAGMPSLPEVSPDVEAAAQAEAALQEEHKRALRAELSALRETCARIDALVGEGQLELPV